MQKGIFPAKVDFIIVCVAIIIYSKSSSIDSQLKKRRSEFLRKPSLAKLAEFGHNKIILFSIFLVNDGELFQDNSQKLSHYLYSFQIAQRIIMQKQTKSNINITFIGDVDSGKTTTIDHLLFKYGTDKRTKELFEYEHGKGSFRYAQLVHPPLCGHERGVAIRHTPKQFETEKHHFTIVEGPGYRDFLKGMITGSSKADCAALMISTVAGEYQAGISKDGKTREHALLVSSLGVKQMIVCLNKIDNKTVTYSEQRCTEIKKDVSHFLKKVGYDPDKISFIPISGWNGDNLVEKSANTAWYKGPTLIQALDSIQVPKIPINRPLRLPIQDIYKIKGIGTVAVGRVETGILKLGMNVCFAPSNIKSEIVSIQKNNEPVSEALPGDNVGFTIKDVDAKDLKRGLICGSTINDPPKEVEEFLAQIIILDHPTQIENGYTPVLVCHTSRVACRFTNIKAKIDRRQGTIIEKEPKSIKNGDSALVVIRPTRPICCELFSDYPSLGRFAVRDLNKIIAVGMIKEIKRKEE